MRHVKLSSRSVLLLAVVFIPGIAAAQLEPKCVENSPERQGGIGCSYIEDKPLPSTLKEPLYWHIDKFGSADDAKAAVSPVSVAFPADGTWWLFTIESVVDDHHGGQHVAQVKLPPLPPAKKYSLLIYSAYIPPPLTSRVHHHSGPEAFYVVEGEQCLRTEARAYVMHKGDTLAVPAGVTMQLVSIGTLTRRSFAVVVYDASQPPTMRTEPAPPLAECK
jgi:quercetin dioxygenase-like cupin family protein